MRVLTIDQNKKQVQCLVTSCSAEVGFLLEVHAGHMGCAALVDHIGKVAASMYNFNSVKSHVCKANQHLSDLDILDCGRFTLSIREVKPDCTAPRLPQRLAKSTGKTPTSEKEAGHPDLTDTAYAQQQSHRL